MLQGGSIRLMHSQIIHKMLSSMQYYGTLSTFLIFLNLGLKAVKAFKKSVSIHVNQPVRAIPFDQILARALKGPE